MITISDVRRVLRNVQGNASDFSASCPLHSHGKGHGDRNPSLHVSAAPDGKVLVKCYAGCDQTELWAAIRGRVGDGKGKAVQETPAPSLRVKSDPLSVERHVEPFESALDWETDAQDFLAGRGISEAVWRRLRFGFTQKYFRCGAGCPLCQKYPAISIPVFGHGRLLSVEYRNIRPPDVAHKWIYQTGSIAQFVYLAEMEPTSEKHPQTAVVVESLLDAAMLRSTGFNGLGLPSGSGIPAQTRAKPEFLEQVATLARYQSIALLPDRDPVGRAVMEGLARMLHRDTVFLMPPKINGQRPKDAGEWRKAVPLDFAAQLSRRLAIWEGYVQKTLTEHRQKSGGAHLVLRNLDAVKQRPVEWVWEGKIPKAKLVIFSGNPDCGKTTVCCDIVARYTTGRDFPDGAPAVPAGDVLILAAEDDPADTLKPRLAAAGAAASRVHIIETVSVPSGASRDERQFALDRDLKLLYDACRENPAIGMVLCDPVTSYLGAKDLNKEQQVRELLGPVAKFCQETGVTFLGTGHFSKRSDVTALHKVGGAVAVTGVSRSVWLFAKDPEREDGYMMLPGKANLARRKRGLRYTIGEATLGDGITAPVIVWGDAMSGDPDVLLSLDSESRIARKAEHFLSEALADGKPHLSTALLNEAKERGIGRSTLFVAKKELGVKAAKKSGEWFWQLEESNAGEEGLAL